MLFLDIVKQGDELPTRVKRTVKRAEQTSIRNGIAALDLSEATPIATSPCSQNGERKPGCSAQLPHAPTQGSRLGQVRVQGLRLSWHLRLLERARILQTVCSSSRRHFSKSGRQSISGRIVSREDAAREWLGRKTPSA